MTVVKGGQQANLLVQAMRSPWGKALYSKTLIKNIAQAIYQVCRSNGALVHREGQAWVGGRYG